MVDSWQGMLGLGLVLVLTDVLKTLAVVTFRVKWARNKREVRPTIFSFILVYTSSSVTLVDFYSYSAKQNIAILSEYLKNIY